MRSGFEKYPIIHLHGTLGPLPWQAATSTREFDFNVSPQAISVAAANIKIIHEDIRDGRDKEFERAKALIKAASRILFMGFGYNPTNMERLGLVDLVERKRSGACQVFGTCVGMGDYERSTAYAASHSVIELMPVDCESAPKWDPARVRHIELIFRGKSDQGWGPDRRRSGSTLRAEVSHHVNVLRSI
jgi:hypothetical protein